MLRRLPLFVRHIMYNLRGGFLVRPLIITLVLGLTGALLSSMESSSASLGEWVPRWLFQSRSDPQVAQVILGGIATSVMTVVSIVFAILLMTLTLASMQFSPRIIVSFAKDRATQWTLGIFLGTFCYCIAALPAAHSFPFRFEPVVTVMGAMLLSLLCVAWLLFFIHHISQAISVNYIVDNIARETEAVIVEMMPVRALPGHFASSDKQEKNGDETRVSSDVSGYIRYIDSSRLLALAKSYHIAIHVIRRVGHFVPAGVALATISKEHKSSQELANELRAAFDIGPSRTLQQDIEFGILQIVDIALKAISPAVNDPTTAINCVDQLSRILICFATREAAPSLLYDPPGVLRVAIPQPDLERLVDSAFEQIRVYAKGDVAVSLRLLRALADIGCVVPESADNMMLVDRADRVVFGAAEKLGDAEIEPLRIRLGAIKSGQKVHSNS